MRFFRLSFATVVLTNLALLAGCGPPISTVSGEVAVDGKPLEEGDIVFSPADDNGIRVAAKVKAGKYQATMVAGKKLVQISAQVVIAQHNESDRPGAPLIPQWGESLPPRYNSESELTFDVLPGVNTKDWALERDGKP